MSQITNEQNLIQALEHYINHGTTMHDMHQVARYLKLQPSITVAVHQKFYDMLSDMDFLKIKRAIELLEYLTAFCPDKIPTIVNDDKFMEYISQGLMESFLQDEVLNLIRFWADEYNDSKKDMNLVYLLIENLETFQIALPATYQSNYKTMAANMAQTESQGPENEPTEEVQYPPKLQDLIQKATNVQNEINHVLSGGTFEHQSLDAKRTKINFLLSKNFAITSDISELNLKDQNFVEKADDIKEELRKSRSKLHEKLGLINRPGPVNNFPPPPQAQPQTAHDPYKIVISETENNPIPPGPGQDSIENRIMEFDELLSFKSVFCPQGAACTHAPNPASQTADQITTYNSEMHCQYWHSPLDRRRAVLDDNYKLNYSFNSCQSRPVCTQQGNCNSSHNFFEKYYHPLNYKKNKCRFPNSCKNGRFCPYYHTTDEREIWEDHAQPYFELLESSNDYQENNENITDLLNSAENNDFGGSNVRTYPPNRPHVAGPQPDTRSSPAGGVDEAHDYINMPGGGAGSGQSGVERINNNRSQNPSSFGKQHGEEHSHPPTNLTKAQDESQKGTLNSKLIVRKKYENPDILTSLFHSSQMFNGMPFFTHFPVQKQNENGNDSSSPNKE